MILPRADYGAFFYLINDIKKSTVPNDQQLYQSIIKELGGI